MRYSGAVDVEAVILTGGRSSRMGERKASLVLHDETMSARMTRLLNSVGVSTVILGPEGIPDEREWAGPLAAIAAYKPQSPWVFLLSCDIPRFDPNLVQFFMLRAEEFDAVLPLHEGRVQPLCGLYRAHTFPKAAELIARDVNRVLAWVELLPVKIVSALDLATAGFDPRSIMGANTPEEWIELSS